MRCHRCGPMSMAMGAPRIAECHQRFISTPSNEHSKGDQHEPAPFRSVDNHGGRAGSSARHKLLPEPPYGLPLGGGFEAERLGGFQRKWLEDDLPQWKSHMDRQKQYLPAKEEFWRIPPHEALELMARHRPYHDTLRLIMEQSYFFLFETVIGAADAPMPHVIYEDFLKCLTFASLQCPPEEQFALSPRILRQLLCMAAHYCILDPHYFTSAQLLFRKMEQQQSCRSEVLSAWVFVCAAAGRTESAMGYARYMTEHNIPFDSHVSSLLQHPSVSPMALSQEQVPHTAKGLLLQRRLSERLQTEYSAAAVAIHSMFVFYILTLQPAKKWEVLRLAMERECTPAARTLQLALKMFASEKGLRCGPKTVMALVWHAVQPGSFCTAGDLLYILLRVRKNELLPSFAQLPKTVFTEAEATTVMHAVYCRAQGEASFRTAAPLIRTLLHEDNPVKLFDTLQKVSPGLQHAEPLFLGNPKEEDLAPSGTNVSGDTEPDGDGSMPVTEHQGRSVPAATPATTSGDSMEVVRSVFNQIRALDMEWKAQQREAARRRATDRHDAPQSLHSKLQLQKTLQNLQTLGAHSSQQAFTQRILEEEEEETRVKATLPNAWIGLA